MTGAKKREHMIAVSFIWICNCMWYESLPSDRSWSSLWSEYIRCECGGIRTFEGQCPACGVDLPNPELAVVYDTDGKEYRVPPVFAGGEGRYEDYVYLMILEREWLRPVTDADRFHSIPEGHRPSARAIIVLVFWTYFETRIERLFRETAQALPKNILEDLLSRYSSVGARVDRLYKIVFSTTYWKDLDDLGYSNVSTLLKHVHTCRNSFVHGQPEAIDDALVEKLIEGLKDEHKSWIAVFNRRIGAAQT